MSTLRGWFARLGGLFGKESRERELAAEIESHVQMHVEDNLQGGMTLDEARRQALLKLGGVEQAKEMCRDRRGVPWLEDLLRDVRYALRDLAKNPNFTIIALLTLALGTGATTAIFTLISGVLLKPLTYPHPNDLITVHAQTNRYGDSWGLSYPDFLDSQRDSEPVMQMASWTGGGGTVTEPGEAQYVDGREISSGYFLVLGIPLVRGREFLPEEDRAGGAPVAIISYGLWQRLYGGRDAALGMPLVFESKRYTVVGVAPAGFGVSEVSAEGKTDLYTPLGQNTQLRLRNRAARMIRAIGRLRPGVTFHQAQTAVRLIGLRLAKDYPDDAEQTFGVRELRQEIVGDVRPTLWLLLGAVGLLLMIACANVASLLLARAVSRERELAVRFALGATRGRLVRQCLAEGTVLALCGGVLGLLLATIGFRPFVTLWPGSLPRAEEIHLDWRVWLFALLVSTASGLILSIAPALRASASNLERTFRSESHAIAKGSRLHSAFVATQIGLATILVLSAGLLGRTILRLSSLNPGFDGHNVVTARVALPSAALATPAQTRATWRDLIDHAQRVPGVRSVAVVDTIPMREGINPLGYSASASLPPVDRMPLALATSVTPDYLNVMGVRLREGRFFTEEDRSGAALVIVIDEVLARHAFAGKDPVGQRLWVPAMGPAPVQIVGVVSHVRHWGLAGDDESSIRDQMYYPFAQVPDSLIPFFSTLMSVAVRTDVPPLNVVKPLEEEIRRSSSGSTLYEIRTMDQLASESISRQHFLLVLFAIFAGLALLLACVGIYGLLSYVTGRRVREIGVRMAIGATPQSVVRLVLGQSILMIATGLAAGIAGSLAAGRLLASSVTGVRSNDPFAFVIVTGVLIAAALAASLIPAIRASRIDPTIALRYE
jgi:predicted permease